MNCRLWNVLLNFLPGKSTANWGDVRRCVRGRPTVILVAGFAANYRSLSVIRKRLLQDGFNVVVLAMDWQSISESFLGLRRMATKLSTLVINVRKELGMDAPIYLVAHSAGGLVARYYVQELGGFHYCNGLTTLATPHQGTWKALFGLFSHLILKARVLWQLTPKSDFLRALNQAPFPAGFRMVCFSSREDLLCPPTVTKLPEPLAQLPHVQSVEMRRFYHSDFLMSKRIYTNILGSMELSSGLLSDQK